MLQRNKARAAWFPGNRCLLRPLAVIADHMFIIITLPFKIRSARFTYFFGHHRFVLSDDRAQRRWGQCRRANPPGYPKRMEITIIMFIKIP